MKTFKTTATTKRGSFDVTVTVDYKTSPITGCSYQSIKAVLNLNGKEVEARVDKSRKDRIYASFEMCKEFGIQFDNNIALQCDVSEAIDYANEESRKGYRMLAEAEQMHKDFLSTHNL